MERYDNYPDLASDLANDLFNKIEFNGIDKEIGYSNVGASTYVNLLDEIDGEEFKIRFSDHAPKYGCDICLRFDGVAPGIYDEGEYLYTEISKDDYDRLIEEAYEAAKIWYDSLEERQ